MEVDISAMMVVAALRIVDVVGEAGSPRQMSWYLVDNVMMMTSVLEDTFKIFWMVMMDEDMSKMMVTYLPSEEEQRLMQSSRSFSKEDWHSRRSFLLSGL